MSEEQPCEHNFEVLCGSDAETGADRPAVLKCMRCAQAWHLAEWNSSAESLLRDNIAVQAQLAEALSQRQAAVEEAERLREEKRFLIETDWDVTRKVQQERDRLERELAAANQDAAELYRCLNQWVNGRGDLHQLFQPARLAVEAHRARLASQPPAEAEGA